jgi:aspartate kinase
MVEPRKRSRRLVVKFGGSTLADGERISKAVGAIADEVATGSKLVVVVSAMGKTTDHLLETANRASRGEVAGQELDDILSMGERTSSRIFMTALSAKGVKSRYLDPTDPDWPIITDRSFGDAAPLLEPCRKRIKRYIQPLIEQNIVPVIPGFVGKTLNGEITTLGRGGSDTTAFVLARYLLADEVVLVTDVDGILTADPKLVDQPKRLSEVDADILARIADSGTKFIHKKALKYKDEAIPVRVIKYSEGRLDAKGTLVTGAFPRELCCELASRSEVASLTVVGRGISEEPAVVQEIVAAIKNRKVPLLGASINYDSLIAYIPQNHLEAVLKPIHSIVLRHKGTVAVAVRQGLAFLKVMGVGLEETPGVVGKISDPLRQNRINIFGIFTITSSIIVFVSWNDREKAMALIRDSLKVDSND